MNAHHTLQLALGGAIATMGLLCARVDAEQFPSRPLRLVVPFAPGGPADVIARIIMPQVSERLGQNVVIDNRPGAAGAMAGDMVARARPDGYTLLLCSTSVIVINPLLTATPTYDPTRDLSTVSLLSSSPYLLLTHPSFAATSIRELIEMARAKPGSLNFGSAGTGSTSHLVMEVFRSMARIQLTHVPYKGTGPAAIDLAGGHLQLLFEAVSSGLPSVRAGRVRALGISTRKRFGLVPDIPPIAESGVPGFEGTTWQGICAPSATPRAIIGVLNRAVAGVVRTPQTAERFATLGAEAVGDSPEAFAAYLRQEITRWSVAIREAGVKPQ